jgi:hypothetical protein
VLDAVKAAVIAGAPITPRVEQQVQEALAALRGAADAENVKRAEQISTTLVTLVQAKRSGRPNFHASQLLRLARA